MTATNLGSIFWRVDADTSRATNGLRDLNRQARITDRGVGAAARSIASAVSKIAAGVSIGLLVNKLVQVQREFDKLNASLLTSTGSVDGASMAFKELEKFAAKTPYALEQSVTAFTKLVNFGLTPSEDAMLSFGNTAAAMGKDLNQMIEAVADAVTGEFERLKEFGIKAKNQGDTIAFTFQGTTKTVKNNAAEIEGYLTALGKNNFAGAMANRMDTLDGAISNMSDTWDQLFRTVNSQGAGNVMADGVNTATTAIKGLIFLIESGKLSGIIGVVANSWRAYFSQIADDVATFTTFVASEFDAIKTAGSDVPKFIADAFFQLPENIKAAVQIATIELLAFVDKAKLMAEQINRNLNPFSDDEPGGFDAYEAAVAQVEQRKLEMVTSILKEREKGIKVINDERDAVKRNTLEFKKNAEIKASAGGGILKQFKIQPEENDESDQTIKGKKKNIFSDSYGEVEGDFASSISNGMLSENETLLDELNRHRELILEFQEMEYGDAEAHAANLAVIEQEITDEKKKQLDLQSAYQIANANLIMSASSDLFGGLASLLKSSGNEQSNAYKAMFALSKGFAVAQAGLNLSLAISEASKVAWPASIPLMATAASQGAGLLSAIAGATYSGRENGGSVVSGQTYEVGEKNKPEMLMIPGNNGKVFSNAEMKNAMSGGGGGGLEVNLYGAPEGTRVESRQDPLSGKRVLDMIVGQMTDSNSKGRRGMQRTSNLTGVLNGGRRS